MIFEKIKKSKYSKIQKKYQKFKMLSFLSFFLLFILLEHFSMSFPTIIEFALQISTHEGVVMYIYFCYMILLIDK